MQTKYATTFAATEDRNAKISDILTPPFCCQNGCLYIRVSTDNQLELSPDAQQRLLLDYAHKNNIIISKEHIFLEHGGISGRKAEKRPAFQEMIAICKDKSHPIDVILVWKFSRFARN